MEISIMNPFLRKILRIALLSTLAILYGCDSGPKGSLGFTLPDGDAEKGRANYIAFQCHACHASATVSQLNMGKKPEISVFLGGKTTRIKTYGELVTSIINPSHKLAKGYAPDMIQQEGKSRMTKYNDVMTVSELIDVVAFVQSGYELMAYYPTIYPSYKYYGP